MSRYLKYILENIEPVRIANDETSQHGQTDTIRYFPGSSIRGAVISTLAAQPDFCGFKKQFFSGKIHFLNAYPYIQEQVLFPSLKGFYEDKTENQGKKKLDNVITKDVEPGFKRAALGHFCYLEGDCIRYTDVDVSEDLNINMGRNIDAKRTVYRSQHIRKNQRFAGYITFADDVDDGLVKQISQVLNRTVYLGNRRTAGYGACKCLDKTLEEGIPYQNVRTGKGGSDFYMVLLSGTVMRDGNGELAGLYLPELADRLGCEGLEIDRCSTSITDVRGYNTMWHATIPSAVMYEAGSVFHLKATGEVTEERLRKMERDGIGIRREEGFGQVAFLKDFPSICYKLAVKQESEATNQESEKGLEYPGEKFGGQKAIDDNIWIAAVGLLRNRLERGMKQYVVDNPLKLASISKSKQGVLTSMCMELQYAPQEAKRQILAFAEHDCEKSEGQKIHGVKGRQDAFYDYIHRILDGNLYTMFGMEQKSVMGKPTEELLSEDDILKYKLKLMVWQIRYANREEKNNAG